MDWCGGGEESVTIDCRLERSTDARLLLRMLKLFCVRWFG
jgi:hypothetical protein